MADFSLKALKKWLGNAKKEYLVAGVFAVLVLLFYGNSLGNGFVHDDIGQVVQNEYVHSLKYFYKVFTGCTWEYTFGGNCKEASYYRPLQSLSYLLTWQISSSPWFFHLVNLIYFLIGVFLIFILIRKLTKNFIISFLTAIFFLIHPMNNETVNWIATVPELLFAIFILLSTIYFIKYCENNSTKEFILCSVFYLLAILAKEPAISLPIIFLFIDWKLFNARPIYYLPEQTPEQTGETPCEDLADVGASKEENTELASPKGGDDFDIGIGINFKVVKKYLVFLTLALIYIAARMLILGGLIGPRQLYFGLFSAKERIYAFVTLFGQYVAKLFVFYPSNFFYYFEKESDFLSPKFLGSLFVLAVFIGAIYFFIKKKHNLLALFFIWFIAFLWQVLVFVYSCGENVFSERYLFVSTIGFAFILANIFNYFWQKKKNLHIYLVVIIILIAVVSWVIIFPRNKIFKNDGTLYKATLVLNPRAHALRRNMAAEMMAAGDYETARVELEKIIQMDPNWWEIDKVYNMLGDYYREKGDAAKTIEYYEKTIEVSGNWNYKPYNNLGAFYASKQEYLKSLTYLCKAGQLGGGAKEVQNNLNRVISLIESVENQEGLKKLYSDITSGEIFKESNEGRIGYIKRICAEDGCDFSFFAGTANGEVLFPFLVLASDPLGGIIKMEDRVLDPQTRTIHLRVDPKYQNQVLTFVFPTCDRIYYMVDATIANEIK